MSERPIKCVRNYDESGRIILQKGDIVGVAGRGLPGWMNRNFVRPRTDMFHFLLIGDYIPTEDDYTTLESVKKGVTIGRLSWYKGRAYTVFRLNWTAAEHFGRQAFNRASQFGRHRYDWFMAAGLVFTWVRHGFRPLHVADIPYERDDRFLCTELVFEAYRLAGIRLREQGHAPLPAEIKLAAGRNELVQIDSHDGRADYWRKKAAPPDRSDGVVMAMKDAVPGEWVERRDPVEVKGPFVPYARAGERIKRGDMVWINDVDGLVYKIHPFQEPYSLTSGEAPAAAFTTTVSNEAPGYMTPTFVAKLKKSNHPGRDKTHLWVPVPDRPSLRTDTVKRVCDSRLSGAESLNVVHVVTDRRVRLRPDYLAALEEGWVSCHYCKEALRKGVFDLVFPATYYAKPEGGQ
jgi:hypothetical protein